MHACKQEKSKMKLYIVQEGQETVEPVRSFSSLTPRASPSSCFSVTL